MKNNKQSAVRKVGADRDFLAPDRRFYYLWCYGAVVTCNDRSRFEVQNRFSIIKSNESGNGHGFPGFLNQITRHCKIYRAMQLTHFVNVNFCTKLVIDEKQILYKV